MNIDFEKDEFNFYATSLIFGQRGSKIDDFGHFNFPMFRHDKKVSFKEYQGLNTDGKIDVIAGCDNSYVYAINGDTGLQLWSIDLDGSVRDIDLFQMDDWGVIDVIASAGNQIAVINGSKPLVGSSIIIVSTRPEST